MQLVYAKAVVSHVFALSSFNVFELEFFVSIIPLLSLSDFFCRGLEDDERGFED